MKIIFYAFIVSLFLSCMSKSQKSTTVSQTCICVDEIKPNQNILATNVFLKEQKGEKFLYFQCVAEKSHSSKVNDKDIDCISADTIALKLKDDFIYFFPELAEMKITQDGVRNYFFAELNRPLKLYYQFTLNENKEITHINRYDNSSSVEEDNIKSISVVVYGGDMGVSETYVITKDSVHFVYYLAADTTKNNANSSVNSSKKWESLLEKVDIDAFKELTNGRSKQMADGTDMDIIITTDKGEYIKTNGQGNKAWDAIYEEFIQQVR